MNQELPILKRNCLPPKELLCSLKKAFVNALESHFNLVFFLGNLISDFTAIGVLRESGSQIPYFNSSILTETTTKAWATHASEKEDLVIAAKEEVGTKDAKVRLSCKDPSASFRV